MPPLLFLVLVWLGGVDVVGSLFGVVVGLRAVVVLAICLHAVVAISLERAALVAICLLVVILAVILAVVLLQLLLHVAWLRDLGGFGGFVRLAFCLGLDFLPAVPIVSAVVAGVVSVVVLLGVLGVWGVVFLLRWVLGVGGVLRVAGAVVELAVFICLVICSLGVGIVPVQLGGLHVFGAVVLQLVMVGRVIFSAVVV